MRAPRETEPIDARSTQRKRARKKLFYEQVPFICGAPHWRTDGKWCGKSPPELPPDAPQDLELSKDTSLTSTLQANHITKNIMDNDLVNLEWLCPSCHKLEDSKTEKGVSQKGTNTHGYEI
jgi:hypothetical protein